MQARAGGTYPDVMTPPRHVSPQDHRIRNGALAGATWVLLGLGGSLVSATLATSSLGTTARTALVMLLFGASYWIWFRVGRWLGFIDRGALASLRQTIEGATGPGGTPGL